MSRRQGIYWVLTVPHHLFLPYLPPNCAWVRGQLELGTGGYLHWQIVLALRKKGSLSTIKTTFGDGLHAELSRSESANDYVWKDETAVIGTRFELGERAFKRNDPKDWDAIWTLAASGDLLAIPAQIRVQSYHTLRSICADHSQPIGMERTCHVFWGRTGTGKSRAAWEAAGLDAYPKDPNTKFWCGYSGQDSVVIDEFRGRIDVSHLLRWLDRYPVTVEIKGSSRPLCASSFWITSNVDPRSWYPDCDQETIDALVRRINITHFHYSYIFFCATFSCAWLRHVSSENSPL